MADDSNIDSLRFASKKSIHVNVSRKAHADFKTECVKRDLSMQSVIDYLIQLIADEDPRLIRILDKLKSDKLDAEITKFSKRDAESILDVIEKSFGTQEG